MRTWILVMLLMQHLIGYDPNSYSVATFIKVTEGIEVKGCKTIEAMYAEVNKYGYIGRWQLGVKTMDNLYNKTITKKVRVWRGGRFKTVYRKRKMYPFLTKYHWWSKYKKGSCYKDMQDAYYFALTMDNLRIMRKMHIKPGLLKCWAAHNLGINQMLYLYAYSTGALSSRRFRRFRVYRNRALYYIRHNVPNRYRHLRGDRLLNAYLRYYTRVISNMPNETFKVCKVDRAITFYANVVQKYDKHHRLRLY